MLVELAVLLFFSQGLHLIDNLIRVEDVVDQFTGVGLNRKALQAISHLLELPCKVSNLLTILSVPFTVSMF